MPQIDIDMYNFDTDDIIDALAQRYLTDRDKSKVTAILQVGGKEKCFIPENLDRELKLELFIEVIDSYTFTDLEKRLR